MKVLICSVNWLGDCIMTMPAIQIFKLENPNAGIDILVKEKLKGIWSMHEAIDNVISYNEKTTWQIAKQLKNKYDQVFVLPNSFRSALIPFLAQIPKRTAVSGQLRAPLINDKVKLSTLAINGHQSLEYMEIFGNSNYNELPMPNIKVNKKTGIEILTSEVKETLPEKKILAILPGAAYGPSKMWPTEYFIMVAQNLIQEKFVDKVIVLGTDSEFEICEEVHKNISESINLAGKTNFAQLTALLALSVLTIANDNGGMHLATACGTKVIGIFGITDPYKTGPVGSNSTFITNDDFTHSRDIPRISEEATKCLKSIKPETVTKKAKLILQHEDK
jgi:heptosyltransferase II